MATVLYVELDGVDKSSLALGATVTLKTINQGHCTWNAVLDNNDQSLNGLYDSEDVAYIKMGGADIVKGYIDDVNHIVTHDASTWHHLLRVSGRDYSQDLSNLFISKVWAAAKKGDEIIDEALARVVSEITYAAPASAATIGGYEPHQQYLMDLCKDVLDRVNWEAYVDTNKALQAFAIGTVNSALTLTYSDLVGNLEYTEKTGLGLRNKIYGIGENLATTTTDEYTEPVNDPPEGWTSGGTLSRQGGGPVGVVYPRAWQNGGPTASVYMEHDLDYAVQSTGEDIDGNDTSKCHFYIQCWAYTPPADVVDVTDAYLQLREDSTNYFQYNFTEADIQVAFTEFNLGLGRDNESGWVVNGAPDWAGINKIRFYATTTTKQEVFIDVDGMDFADVNYVGYSSDATSRTTYRRRMELQQDDNLTSSTMAQDLSDSILEKKKDPLEHINLTVDGNSCISGGVYKLWPGYKVTLNFPKIGMTNEVWRVESATLKCYPHGDLSGHGHDFTALLSCIPYDAKMDHLEYSSLANPRSAHHFWAKEAYKRRANKTMLP